MSQNVNKKSFVLIKRVSKSFKLLIDNFQIATTLLFRIIMRMPITFIISVGTRIISTISLKINLVFSELKLIANIVQTIDDRNIGFIVSISQRLRSIVTIVQHHPILFPLKALLRMITIISEGFSHIGFTIILANFYNLAFFDPNDLGTLDSQTLGQMDYTVL